MNRGNPFCPNFDSTPCSRCNASGKRPSATGLVRNCFPCAGSGRALTRRGRVAREYMRGLLLTPVVSVVVGDNLWFCTKLRKDFARVVRIEQQNLTFVLIGLRSDGQKVTARHRGDDLIERARTADELLQVCSQVETFQRSLTQAGYPRRQLAKLAA